MKSRTAKMLAKISSAEPPESPISLLHLSVPQSFKLSDFDLISLQMFIGLFEQIIQDGSISRFYVAIYSLDHSDHKIEQGFEILSSWFLCSCKFLATRNKFH